MMMTRYLAAAVSVGMMLFLSCSKEGMKTEYKLTLNVPATFYWGKGAAKFAELAERKTGGRVKIKPFYSSTLLKGAQMKSAQMVATGVIDCAFESTINLSTVIPEMNLFSLPFFINTFERLDAIEKGGAGKKLFAAMEAKGLKPLAWGENGFRQVTNSKKELVEPADFKGMRIRVVGSPIFVDIFRALGADPVNMNWGDAVTAFGQGVVDGQENPVGVLIPVQIHQYHKYATFWNYVVDPLIIYWNKKQWEAFPPDIQAALAEAAEEAALYEKSLSRAGLDGTVSLGILKDRFGHIPEVPDPIRFLTEKGVKVTGLFDDTLEQFRLETMPVYDTWVPKIGADLVALAEQDMEADERIVVERETTPRAAAPREPVVRSAR